MEPNDGNVTLSDKRNNKIRYPVRSSEVTKIKKKNRTRTNRQPLPFFNRLNIIQSSL